MTFKFKALIAAAAIALAGSAANAATFGFGCIPGEVNSATNCGTLESQITVDVTGGAGTVSFKFMNAVGLASSITDVYFDDSRSSLLVDPASMSIASSAGVSFSALASPSSPPSGGGWAFFVVDPVGASADSDAPVMSNGVNAAGEFLTLTFNLVAGKSFTDVIAAMLAGNFFVGTHVQAFSDGGSEWGLNKGECVKGSFECPEDVSEVPLPATLPLLLGGLLGTGLVARRARKSA